MLEFADSTRRGLIPEDLAKFSWLEQFTLSPGGQHIAYTVRRPDLARNGYQTHIYLTDLVTHSTVKLTQTLGQATSPSWSRDGSMLAFTWLDDGGARIVVVAADGSPVRSYPVTGATPSDLDWSPDGTRLACIRWTPMRSGDAPGIPAGVPAPTVRVVTRLRYKMDGVGWVEDRYRQVWVLQLDTGDFIQITDAERDCGEPRWSWDSSRLAFTCQAREMDTPLGHGQIFIFHALSGDVTPMLPDWQGIAKSPQWRADDGAIVFAGHNNPPPVNNRIFSHVWLCDLDRGATKELSADKDEEVGNYCVADQRGALGNVTVKWPGGRGKIYFLLSEQGACQLYSTTEAGGSHLEVGGECVVFEYAPSADGPLVYGKGTPASPGDLFLLQHGVHTRLTDLNPWLRSRVLSTPETYWYEGVDGAKVHAWVIKPVGFEAGKRYPTILQVHCSQFSWDFSHEFQCMAAAGYVVAYFNQRGTTAGYGQAWTRASEGDQGGKDYEEIMLGLDELVQRPYVDASRLGVTGGSCGGILTNWIVGHTDRFAAAVTQRSIANNISAWGTSDIGPEMIAGETAATPWTDLDAMWRQSALAYAENIHTPLLIIHSDQDYRCPLEQAEQLFAALRWLGREVEMVIFQGESHGLSRGGRPGNRVERQRRIIGWFRKYLGVAPVSGE